MLEDLKKHIMDVLNRLNCKSSCCNVIKINIDENKEE
jgi:hypothetical protein